MPDQLTGTHVLIVEDNPANLLLIQAVMQRTGCRLSVAGSAEEALRCIAVEPPDIVLMDIQLPGRDGLSLTRELKADAATANIPIVALTAHAMKDDQERAFAAGCAGYIAKPINVRSFPGEVAAVLEANRRK